MIVATFNNVAQADGAQAELRRAGIHALLLSDQPAVADPDVLEDPPVSLAVNQRDADVARALLAPTLDAN